jgi:hypothetical protein
LRRILLERMEREIPFCPGGDVPAIGAERRLMQYSAC